MPVAQTPVALAGAINTDVGNSVFAAPPTGNHAAVASALRAKGVLTAAGAYAAGKGQSDVEAALRVPGPTQKQLWDAACVLYC